VRAIGDLWAGQLPLGEAFWKHAVAIGFAVNLAATTGGLSVLIADGPSAAALAVYLSPVPYMVACVVGVWRSAARHAGPPRQAEAARVAVLVWAALLLAV